MKIPLVGRVWPFISAYAKTLLAAADQAAAQSILGVSGGGGGTPGLTWTYTAGAMAVGKFKADQATQQNTGVIQFSKTAKNGTTDMEGYLSNMSNGSLLTLVDAAGAATVFVKNSTADNQPGYISFNVVTVGWPTANLWTAIDFQMSLGIVGPPLGLATAAYLDAAIVARVAGDVLDEYDAHQLDHLTPEHLDIGTFPDGMAGATQPPADSSTKLATTAYADGAASDAKVAAQAYADGLAAYYATAIQGTAADNAYGAAIFADTGWAANQSAGDKTVVVQDYDPTAIDGYTATLNGLVGLSGFGTALAALAEQMEDVTKKLQAAETALAAQLRPNA